ncbi:hypothetical protein [Marinimicrobium sp. C2-29]|uniref:hypothetical protein n=1 Tax=Marinimicrobium sp. C2-29 TaxID=3139825 RepID=UPI00313A29DF
MHPPPLTLLFITLFSLAAALTGCGGSSGDDGGSPTPTSNNDDPADTDDENNDDPADADDQDTLMDLARQLHSMDVSGAQGFVITDRADDDADSTSVSDALGFRTTDQANGDANSTDGQRQIQRLPIAADMESLSSHEENLEAATLYKVTSDGRLEPVSYNDSDGTELPRGNFEPAAILEIGPDFLYIAIELTQFHPDDPNNPEGSGWTEREMVGLLVNKSTGLAYLAGEVFGPAWDMAINTSERGQGRFSNQVRTDPDGNLYFIKPYEDGLMRVDISNLGNGDLTAQNVINLPHNLIGFEMTGDGSFLVYRGNNSNEDTVYMAHDLLNDESMTIRSIQGIYDDSEPKAAIRGLDGELYLVYERTIEGSGTFESEYELIQLTRDDTGALTGESQATLTGRFASGNEDQYDDILRNFTGNSFGLRVWSHGRQVVSGRLMYFEAFPSAMYEVDIANRTVISHDSAYEPFGDSQLTGDIPVIPTERYVWLSGQADDGSPIIVRYNPANMESITFEFDQNFEVTNYDPMGDRIVFEGLRYSDGATVVGEMTIEGETLNTQVYEASPVAILTLRAITPADLVRIDGNPRDWDTANRLLFGSEGSGPAGSDLLYYSELEGQSEYLGLVEFAGNINQEHHTRIVFDTHALTIDSEGVWVSSGSNQPRLVDESRVGVGIALEFAVSDADFDGAASDLQAIERFERVRYGAVQVNEKSGNENALELDVVFESALGDQTVTIPLSDTEQLEVTRDAVTLISGDQPPQTITVDFPAEDQAGESLSISVDATDLQDPNSVYDVIEADNPEGVVVEETLDSL